MNTHNRKIQITTMRLYITPVRKAITRKTVSVGKDVGVKALFYTDGGNVN